MCSLQWLLTINKSNESRVIKIFPMGQLTANVPKTMHYSTISECFVHYKYQKSTLLFICTTLSNS